MPRLKPSATELRDRTFEAQVQYHAMLLGLKTDVEIAAYLGLSAPTYRYRMKNKSAWSYEELSRMFKKLRFSPESISKSF
jgi:hypothetical protein